MPGIDPNKLKIESAGFEIRYPQAFQLWDRSGIIWSEAKKRWPGLKLTQIQPNSGAFLLDSQFDLQAQLEKSHVVGNRGHKTEKLIDVAATFTDLVVRTLEIDEFSRIGLRLVWTQEFPSKEEASAAVFATKRMQPLSGKHFNIEGVPLYPDYVFRWETDVLGVTARLRAQGEKVDFDPPINFPDVAPIHLERFRVHVDVDYYTLGITSVGQLKCKDWIEQAHRLINRDLHVLIGQ